MRGLFVLLALIAVSLPAQAEDRGMVILKQRCASCHNLSGPAPTTLSALRARRGPDLFYAGDKYDPSWVAAWLQHPKRIRPAGMFYLQHIKPGKKHDVVDDSTLEPHVALSKADAEAVSEAMAGLHAHGDLIRSEKLTPAPSPMGEMMFDKIYGCLACHQIEPEYGGMSGSELYTAGKRLRPEFMLSFIKNPQAWDPKTWMPNKHVPEENVQLLVNYLVELSKESFDE